MPSPLVPCTACGRHVRFSEGSCRFCGGALTTHVPAHSTRQISRAAMVALAAVLVPACGSSDDDGKTVTDAATDADDAVSIDAAYGAPPDTGTVDTGEDEVLDTGEDEVLDTGEDEVLDAPLYGAPPDTSSAD